MSRTYYDTGVALKLVIQEPLSAGVWRFVAARKAPVSLTLLHEMEMENALHALLFRKSITRRQLEGARQLVLAMFREGKFRRSGLPLDDIAGEAHRLAPAVVSRTGCRTFDLMHVAAAQLLGAEVFVSTDHRQREAAKICGLRLARLPA